MTELRTVCANGFFAASEVVAVLAHILLGVRYPLFVHVLSLHDGRRIVCRRLGIGPVGSVQIAKGIEISRPIGAEKLSQLPPGGDAIGRGPELGHQPDFGVERVQLTLGKKGIDPLAVGL